MKRYALEVPLMQRRRREWQSYSFGGTEVEPGRFRKRKPLDCGRARCGLCHSEKRFGRLSAAQRRANEALHLELRDWHEQQRAHQR